MANMAYKLGGIAAANKKTIGENPYPETTNDHWEWVRGFAFILTKLTKKA